MPSTHFSFESSHVFDYGRNTILLSGAAFMKFLSLIGILLFASSAALAVSPEQCRTICAGPSDACTHYGLGAAIIVNPMLAIYTLAQNGLPVQICNRTLEIQNGKITSSGAKCETRQQYGAHDYLRTVIPLDMEALVLPNDQGSNDVFFSAGKALFNEIKSGPYFMGGDIDFISIGEAITPRRQKIIWGTADGSCFAAPLMY